MDEATFLANALANAGDLPSCLPRLQGCSLGLGRPQNENTLQKVPCFTGSNMRDISISKMLDGVCCCGHLLTALSIENEDLIAALQHDTAINLRGKGREGSKRQDFPVRENTDSLRRGHDFSSG